MRWWLNTDHKAFSVDNAFVRDGMDFSSLPPDLWMVHWTDGKGEIEYQDPNGINPNGLPGTNLNGLRETFFDVSPYAQFFQQFLTLLPGLTLDQAKKVQVDLIKQLFESKRQTPIEQSVTAGDYWWDADDSSIMGMNSAVTPHTIGAIFTLGDSTGGTTGSLVAQINANYNTWQGQINAVFYTINADTQRSDQGVDGSVTVITAASPGLSGNLPLITALSVAAGDIGSGAIAIPWLPFGGTVQINLTATDISNILSTVASRRISLQTTMNTKIAQVNVLTTIASVIAYDVLAGWMAISLPPGYVPQAPLSMSGGGGFTLVSSPPASFPEAPVNGLMYGRQNATWQRSLAITLDVLDGGNF
jgi:hypothetical protein